MAVHTRPQFCLNPSQGDSADASVIGLEAETTSLMVSIPLRVIRPMPADDSALANNLTIGLNPSQGDSADASPDGEAHEVTKDESQSLSG